MDAESFALLAVAEHARLVRVTFLLTGDRAMAEECAQQALLRAWERVDRGQPFDSLTAWTTTVALNWYRSQHRRRRREAEALRRLAVVPPDRLPGPSLPLSSEVRAAVLALPLRQREVVVLHYLLDQDVATVARSAGISTGAVKNALFHARAALARRLGVDADPTGLSGSARFAEGAP
jgi:RNA polymerase sigma-70 factor, ECF subfamily